MCFEHKPFISVIMGVRYKRQDLSLLERAIKSILDQTYTHFEFLICQNDSSIAACKLLEDMARDDNRIRLVDGKGADNLAQKLNRCIKEANGTLIARHDDDDYSEPERLERQVHYLSVNPDISFVGCVVKLMQCGCIVGMYRFPERPTIHDFFFTQPYIHPTLLFTKTIVNEVGGYCEESRCDGCEDYDLLVRLYEKGYVGANLQHPYFIYTIPPKEKSNCAFSRRINEVRTRFVLFRRMGFLPRALLYVCKPFLVGLIPSTLLYKIKEKRRNIYLEKGETDA